MQKHQCGLGYKRYNSEEEAKTYSSFCSPRRLAGLKRDALRQMPPSLLHIPVKKKNTMKCFYSHGNCSTYVEKHNILLNSPISFSIGCNYLLKFHYWKNNRLVITFSNLSVANLSLLCSHCQNILKSNISLPNQFVCGHKKKKTQASFTIYSHMLLIFRSSHFQNNTCHIHPPRWIDILWADIYLNLTSVTEKIICISKA